MDQIDLFCYARSITGGTSFLGITEFMGSVEDEEQEF